MINSPRVEQLIAKLLTRLIRSGDHTKRLKLAASFAVGKVLDVGMAQCPNQYLANPYVTGLDVAVPKEQPSNYSRFIQGDCTNLRAYARGETFDTVIALEVIEHLPDYVEFLREAHHVLSRNGRLIISTPNPLLWRTILANAFFPEGQSYGGSGSNGKIAQKPYYGHVVLHLPRVLNAVAQEIGFRLFAIRNSSRNLPFPFLQRKLLYVYEKA
jgi:SAM-dependent methyltransferase